MDHSIIEEARVWLQKFDKSSTEAVGRKALADALSKLVEIEGAVQEMQSRTVARNLIRTYCAKVEEQASRLLAVKEELGWEPLLHWHAIVGEFEDLEIDVPNNFRALRSQLVVEAMLKQAKELSPSERERLIELLSLQVKGTE